MTKRFLAPQLAVILIAVSLCAAAEEVTAQEQRCSLAERYPSKADYVAKVVAAAQALVDERLMLPEHVAWWKARAEAVTVLP